ncbi:MAG: hypothetical protein WBI34_05450, partial [Tenuifilaceae bacterium]
SMTCSNSTVRFAMSFFVQRYTVRDSIFIRVCAYALSWVFHIILIFIALKGRSNAVPLIAEGDYINNA